MPLLSLKMVTSEATWWGSQSCPWWRQRRGSTWWMCRGRWRRQSRRRSRLIRKSAPDPAKLPLCRFVHRLARHMACKTLLLKSVHAYLKVLYILSRFDHTDNGCSCQQGELHIFFVFPHCFFSPIGDTLFNSRGNGGLDENYYCIDSDNATDERNC